MPQEGNVTLRYNTYEVSQIKLSTQLAITSLIK